MRPTGEGLAPPTAWTLAVLILAGSLLASSGCGPRSNPCGGCEDGVCDSTSGKCVNPSSCSSSGTNAGGDVDVGDAGPADAGQSTGATASGADCLRGYSCVDGTCEADEACSSDNPCDRGTCRRGACVNPDSCDEKTDCANGYRCEDGACVEPCATVDCDRGVCEDGECVSRDACPNDQGPQPACVKDETCYENRCRTDEQLCAALDCQRGVCSVEQRTCVNADNCEEDAECKEGFFCNDAGNCEVNACDEQRTVCGRGVCDPVSAKCTNPDTCQSSDECLPMHACVDNSCVPEAEKCGKEGCPGNMLCEYDADELSAECIEHPSQNCRNALDCRDDRVCQGGSCTAPGSCTNDGYEPNDGSGEATSYLEAADDRAIRASVCSGDTDVYTYDTSADSDLRGRFIVDLEYEASDVGIGDVTVRLIDQNGDTWVEKKAGDDGRVSIDKKFGADRRGVYTIEVVAGEDLGEPGVDYTLFADVLGAEVVEACKNAETLDGANASGDTYEASSIAVGATCLQDADETPETIYSFELEERSYVEVEVAPEGNFNVSVALRERCPVPATERACADAKTIGGTEQIEAKLDPGTYTIVVQGARAGKTGEFDLSYRRLQAICTDRDNHCLDDKRVKRCGPEAQKMVEESCTFGCDRSRGACNRIEGDVCRTPIDASGGLERQLTWSNYRDDFNPGAGTCISRNSPDTDGPDAVFEVPLPANHALGARLEAADTQDGALYVLSRCESSAGFCQEGADSEATTEQLAYPNDSNSAETVFVVADSAEGTSGESTIDIDVSEIVCEPGKTACKSGDVHSCNPSGTNLVEKQSCPFGCANAQCRADVCNAAFDVSQGGTWQFDPENYSDDYGLGDDSCLGTRVTGPDLVFDVDVPAGEVLEATVDDNGSSMDAGIYLVSDCSTTKTHASTCRAASQTDIGGPETVQYRNASGQTETLALVVETRYANQSSGGNWTLDVDFQSPTCTPGDTSCADGQTLQYCGEFGLSQQTYSCGGASPSCDDSGAEAGCETPTGDICADAVQVRGGDSVTGDFSGTNALEIGRGKTGQCRVNSRSDEADTIYAIDLDKNDLLTATLSTSLRYAQLYLLEDCFSASSCQQFTEAGQGGRITYMNSSKAQTVYVVVDKYASYGSGSYTLDFDVTPNAVCRPGERTCTSPSTVAKCNTSGSRYAWRLTCSNSCQNGSCQINTSSADTCSSPPSIGSGTVGTIDMNALNDDVSATRSCAPEGSRGNDAVFQVDAKAGQVITVSADPSGRGRPAIFLAKRCQSGSTQSCVAGTDSASVGEKETLRYRVPSGGGGTYFLFFDASYSFYSRDLWDLEIRVQSPVCQPGQILGCDGDDLRYCGDAGVARKSYTCQGTTSPTCYNDQCDQPTGDRCIDPIRVTGDATYSGNFGGDNDVELGKGSVGSCSVDEATTGGDTVYEIPMRKDELLTASLSTSSSQAQMLVMDDCKSDSSCATFETVGNGGTLHYLAKQSKTVFLVVDASTASSSTFSLDIELTANAVCKPGDARCSGGSAEICSDDGKTYNAFSCSAGSGCSNGRCQYDASDVDTCSSAPTLSKGTIAEVDMGQVSDDVDLPSDSCIDGTPGHDAVFAVNASGGEVITASAAPGTGDEPAIYITSGCSNADQTCVAASTADRGGESTSLAYNVPSGNGGTYYVFFDAGTGDYDTSTSWDLDVHVRHNICSPGETLGCTTSGDSLEYCGEHGLTEKLYGCTTSASPSCQNGACVNPSGESCLEPIPVQDGDSESGSFGGTNELELASGEVGSCRVNRSTEGGETFYEVDLAAGELLEADLTTGSPYAQIYVTTNCQDEGACSAFKQAPNGDNVYYYAEQNETVFVVVDAYSGSASGSSYTVDFSVDGSASCAPHTSQCVSGDVDVCDATGSGYDTFVCSAGCTDGACEFSNSDIDSCSSAPDVQAGTRAEIDMSQLSDNVSTSGSCAPKGDSGRDAVYKVQARAGETIDVDVFPGGYDDPAIYLAKSCSSGSPQSCVANSDSEGRMIRESLSYTVPSGAGGTYVVFLDSEHSYYSQSVWDALIRVE